MEFEVKGITYQAQKLDVMKQNYVLKRILPVITSVWTSSSTGVDFQAAAQAVATLPDDSQDFIMDTCLANVQRKQDANWSPIRSGRRLMFDDISLAMVYFILFKVLENNFSDFFLEAVALFQQKTPAE